MLVQTFPSGSCRAECKLGRHHTDCRTRLLTRVGKCVTEQISSHLFVHFGPTFDLSHNHPHDASSEGGGEGEEFFVGGDVLIPWVWVPKVKGQAVNDTNFTWACELVHTEFRWDVDHVCVGSYSIGNQSPQSSLTFSMSSWQRKRSWTSLRAVGGTTSLIHTCATNKRPGVFRGPRTCNQGRWRCGETHPIQRENLHRHITSIVYTLFTLHLMYSYITLHYNSYTGS